MIGLITGIINTIDTKNVTTQDCFIVLSIILCFLHSLKTKNQMKYLLLSQMCSKFLAGVKFTNFVAYIKLMGIDSFKQMIPTEI